MNSRESISEFLFGKTKVDECRKELNRLNAGYGSVDAVEESARARYALSFLSRLEQYREGKASANDLCLNLRDLVLVFGRLDVSDELKAVVLKKGEDYSLYYENGTISCSTGFPAWMTNTQAVRNTYLLRASSGQEAEPSSVGDELLRSRTVYRHYKSLEQKLAVHTALNLPPGYTLLLSQPTGGGKSLVTQMLACDGDQLTIVVVPTIALALDQRLVAVATMKNPVGVHCYRGDQSTEDRVGLIAAIRERTARLVFTSPETILKNSELLGLLERSARDGYLRNVVIDEAHIVPDWGVFFRPDFQILSVLMRMWRKDSGWRLRTYLLSATLSDDVVDTLLALFGEIGRNVQLRFDALRKEPHFCFCPVETRQEQYEKLIDSIRVLPKPMIIYVLEPQDAVDLRARLHQTGYKNIRVFTGDTKGEERREILEGWKAGDYDVVIATSAFGLGVDKPDVRTIIHACVPESLSRFYQEVGRSGRDGLRSLSLLIPCTGSKDGRSDMARAYGLVNKRVLRVESIVNRWKGLLQSPHSIVQGDVAVVDTTATPPTMSEEQAEYAGTRNMRWNVNLLLLLHRIGLVSLTDVSYVSQRNSYLLTLKLRKPSLMSDPECLANELEIPRKREYEVQVAGYEAMKRLVEKPRDRCWGEVFTSLFPLATRVCNGCPVHQEEQEHADNRYHLRCDPDLWLEPYHAGDPVRHTMGSYRRVLIESPGSSQLSLDDVQVVADAASRSGIGTLVIPGVLRDQVDFSGMVLTFGEFQFVAAHAPYLLAHGVLCIFGFDSRANYIVLKSLEHVDRLGYEQILYGRDVMIVPSTGKPIRDSWDLYIVRSSDLH